MATYRENTSFSTSGRKVSFISEVNRKYNREGMLEQIHEGPRTKSPEYNHFLFSVG